MHVNRSASASTTGATFRISECVDWVVSPMGLIVLYVTVYLLPLGVRPLGIPDELRYAEVPREMLYSGDWLVSRLNGLLYFEKPPLGYWLNALSIAVFGENAFAVRLPSALAAGATVLTMRRFLRTSGESNKVADFASFVYFSSFGVLFIGTYAVLDTLFTFFLSLSIILFYQAANTISPRRRALFFLFSGLVAGLGFLTKGFLAVVIPGLVLVPWMIWSGNWKIPFRSLWLVMLGTLVVVLPWAVAVHLSAPDFWRYFVVVEHLNRFAGEEAQHAAPIYYFLFAAPLLLFPWILQFISLLRPESVTVPGSGGSPSVVKLLVCWILLPLLFFSMSKGKLATYILPCMMPVVMLFAIRVIASRAKPNAHDGRRSSALMLIILTVLSLTFLLVQFTDIGPVIYTANEYDSLLFVIFSLSSAIALAYLSFKEIDPERRRVLMGLVTLPIFMVYSLALPGSVIDRKAPGRFLKQFQNIVSADTILVADGSMVHSVAWVFKRQDLYLLSSGELSYGLAQPEATDRLLDAKAVARLKSSLQAGQNMVLFFRGSSPQSLLQSTSSVDATYQQGKFHAVVFTNSH